MTPTTDRLLVHLHRVESSRAFRSERRRWAIKNQEELEAKLPELYEAFQKTVGRTMVAPSLATLALKGPTRAEEGTRH